MTPQTRQSGKAKNGAPSVELHGLDSNTSSSSTQVDYSKLSAEELMNAILERNKDPVIEQMMMALISKIPQKVHDAVEEDKKSRSIVLIGLPEAANEMAPSAKQRHLEGQVSEILDVLDIECRPVEVYRMGNSQPRLVKVVLPSKSHWVTALSNSYRLRNTIFTNVKLRRSMSFTERKHEYELRQECRERNRQLGSRVWVVYRGELRRAQDLPKPRVSGNA